ncbi:TPA: CRISPR-associated protein Cas5 [Clostridium botulinum]
MKFNKAIITSEKSHFKDGMNGKNQNSFKIPPISTVIGTLKNIYGQGIKDFIFGYTFEYETVFKDAATIYKEINPNARSLTYSKRFITDICFIEYLVNPILTVYTNIDIKPIITDVLNLGKTDCLAKADFSKEKVEIINKKAIGYNQWTPVNIGNGIIKRINLETKYNSKKGYYDYYTKQLRLNKEFESNYCVNDSEEGIQLWKYEGIGDIKCYQEK